MRTRQIVHGWSALRLLSAVPGSAARRGCYPTDPRRTTGWCPASDAATTRRACRAAGGSQHSITHRVGNIAVSHDVEVRTRRSLRLHRITVATLLRSRPLVELSGGSGVTSDREEATASVVELANG